MFIIMFVLGVILVVFIASFIMKKIEIWKDTPEPKVRIELDKHMDTFSIYLQVTPRKGFLYENGGYDNLKKAEEKALQILKNRNTKLIEVLKKKKQQDEIRAERTKILETSDFYNGGDGVSFKNIYKKLPELFL